MLKILWVKISRSIILLFSFLNWVSASGQTPSPQERFRHLTIDDGLSQNAIQAIQQDQLGFFWLGTKDGLNRYDGYEFKVFQHTPGEASSLSNNFVLEIFEDSSHQLWIGTKNGLNIYDRQTESFQSLYFQEFVTEENPNVPVSSINQDKYGNIWVAIKEKYLVKLPLVNDTIDVHHPVLVAKAFQGITSLYPDEEHLWVGDQSGLFQFDISGDEISRYTIYTRNPALFKTELDSSVTYITISLDPNFLWLGNGSGICYFEKNTGSYQFYPNHYEEYRYGWGRVHNILTDPGNGKLWVGSGDELMRFDPVTEQYDYFYSRPQERNGFHGTGILASTIDQSGQIWFGTNGYGINIFDSKHTGIKTFIHQLPEMSRLNDFSIRAIYKDKDDNVWISARVLYRWERETGKIVSFEASSNLPEAMGNTEIWSIMQDHEGWLWFASIEGLYQHRWSDSTVIQYKPIQGDSTTLPEKTVYHVYEDKQHRIWAITANYIALLDQESGQFSSIKCSNFTGLEPSFVRIVEDGKGKFWMNSENGLLHFDPSSRLFTAYHHDPQDKQTLSSNVIRSICPDPVEPDKYLWLGTAGGGLNKFDIATKKSQRITTNDGLPDNVVYSVLADQEAQLWMSTNKGLSRFDPVSFTFKNFDVKDGLQSNEFNSGAYHKSEDGELFFGGITGLNYLYPKQLADNDHIPNILITALELGTQKILPGDPTAILRQSISEQKELTLTYKDDIITFSFAAMDFTAPEKNRFKYKLEGWDNSWIEAGTRRTATYTNLPAGSYTFHVTGSNNDGVWNETGTFINMIITPPFWLTWWAKLIYFLLFLSILYTIVNYQLKRTRLKHQLALETVEKRKLQELDQLKSRFFTNISHELRTPLTLILGPIERLKLSLQDVGDQKTLTMVERHVNQLVTMVNQILDLSKLEMGKEKLKEEKGDLIAFLRGGVMSYQSMAESRNMQLSISSELRVAIGYFDHQKIENILNNLLSNAIKYASDGDEVSLTIEDIPKFEKADDLKVPFTFSIKDTGPGIADTHLNQIFNRYYRIENTYDQQITGTGIGLAVVKELVDLHKGSIEVESVIGEGATFRVSLPLYLMHIERSGIEIISQRSVEAGRSQDKEETVMQPGEHVPDGEKDVILVIEDNADVRTLITQVLTPNFITMEAENGIMGITKAKELIPDLIITDVMMPGMNGYEVCHELTHDALTSHIPVLMLTAKSAQEDKLEGYTAGADAYITKPFKSRELLLRTQMLIERRKSLQKRYQLLGSNHEKIPHRNETESKFVQTILDTLQTQIAEPGLDVSSLADAVNMSERQLRRKFKAVFGQSPNQYIRTFRLKKALELLRSHAGNVSEVCYQVGFNNVSYFSKCFREEIGVSPSDVV